MVKTRNVDITLKIDGIKVTQVDSVKFLGVMVDKHLNGKTHINNIEKKIAKNIGTIPCILSKVAYLLPANVLKNLYYTLIYPYLAYCNGILHIFRPSNLSDDALSAPTN